MDDTRADAALPGSPDVPAASSPASTRNAAAPAGAYRVLARKYRPQTFEDLIGQDAMVRTITNAFATGRIPQAWILTGVRGVGKTTTARILARALNYELPDGSVTGPTVAMPTLGLHCEAIMESRHFDVIEMDAASHNGVDDIRQINDAIRYAPVSARYKVYILDEVHMLSTAAFNAVLKTLEEPPPHAKFVFATTEIRKVPITVLSRCQRFDLRRLDADLLVSHLAGIAAKESVPAETEALALIARAAEGSVRDALSLLDQAIAHAGSHGAGTGGGTVDAAGVREMLGLADRARVIDLFEALLRGDIAAALTELRDQYDSGADPLTVLEDLAELTHFVTRVKAVPSVAEDKALSEAERTRGRALATTLSMRVLSRTWQMLLKGLSEVETAAKPIAAAEMVLVRIAYAADLPGPDEVIRALGQGQSLSFAGAGAPAGGSGASQTSGSSRPALRAFDRPAGHAGDRPMARATSNGAPAGTLRPLPASTPEPAAIQTLARFEDLVALAGEKRDLQTRTLLERDVRLVRFEDGKLEIALEPTASKAMIGDLGKKLATLTGRRWMVVVSTEDGQPTLRSQREAHEAEVERGVRADPLVQRVLERFPGAEIVSVKPRAADTVAEEAAAALPPAPEADDDGDPPDMPPYGDDGLDDLSSFGAHRRDDDLDDDF
ncbi:DNA polymerase III subunits gamma and tau [Rhodovulum sp. PH10]|uniref:DNA polymerase III subunit gamma/tau n=1 Tax=Rhodovulum sp. PH10 TaxID=1187851 RepID=UPI00027C2E29|nr:DNA polymerase III subunit gamma/tau [Rhodovulum sp. PH10]EJW10937.1 DNA polymerase III subunits gamma and tau [Rhodovulum sp. PH10]